MRKAPALTLLLFPLVFALTAWAQTHFRFKPLYNLTKPELVKRLQSAKTDTEKLNRLNDLVFYFPLVESPGDIDTVYLNKLITLNQSSRLIDDKPYLTLRRGLREGVKGQVLAELSSLRQAVEEFNEQNIEIYALLTEMRYLFNVTNNQEGRLNFYSKKLSYYLEKDQYHNAAACYHCIAGYYIFRGDLNSAISNYLKADELFKSFSNLWYAHELGVIGSSYNVWGNPQKGLGYVQKAFQLDTKYKFTNDLFNVTSGFANIEYDLKHYESALYYLKKMDSLPVGNASIDSVSNIEYTFVAKALVLVALKRLPEARNELERAKALPPLSAMARVSANASYDLDYAFYKYYMALNDRRRAEAYLLSSYHTAVRYALVSLRIYYLKELEYFYGEQNNTAQAWKYTILYNQVTDSLQSTTDGFKVASYEIEQKEIEQNRRLAAMQQQHAIQEATINQRNIIIWISLLGLLAVLGSLVFIYRQLQVNKRNLAHLKTTQTQLIQAEKMASLGELTAGIAHEIQNPLNFVNNFSEVSVELLAELKAEEEKGNREDVMAIADDLTQNLEKISHHGKRADAIVKGMLQHSQSGSGAKEPTNINALADEYLRLSYHGLRSKDKSFNAELVTHFDLKLPAINVIPQDIGRVMLNLFNNAFYAVNQRRKTAEADYKPEVEVSTASQNGSIIIKVKDNGTGIQDAVKEKIMQPFFTTKPTGEGTGLGLSLSYDIVVKGHGGSIDVQSTEGKGSEFIVKLPLN